ncbi:MAG: helix-turn-helix transcriptional regulator, partial [Hyphomicrobiales bacterium]|nr:helix-turn-helix transcriptional regulator [Hyphomicrobiales bacterium]
MARARSYKLLCPIARGLDRIGDRWTLLILRDLHAGPVRFSELQRGLTGIAANLLTDRLAKLVEDGLIVKIDGAHGTTLYALTALGAKTRDVLFDLALFGGQFPPREPLVRPGNLRTIAVTLGTACQRVVTTDQSFDAAIIVDGEAFALSVNDGEVAMQAETLASPDVVLTTSYEALMAVAEGEINLEDFAANHCEIEVQTAGKEADL